MILLAGTTLLLPMLAACTHQPAAGPAEHEELAFGPYLWQAVLYLLGQQPDDYAGYLSLGFEQRVLIGMLLAGLLAGLLGVNVLALRMSFFGEAISHASILGIGLGLLLASINQVADAATARSYALAAVALVALLAAFAIVLLRRVSQLAGETVIAVVMAACVSGGNILVHQVGRPAELAALLLAGDPNYLTNPDLWILAALLVSVLGFSWFSYNAVVLAAVSAPLGRRGPIRPMLLEMSLSGLLAVTIALLIQHIGVLVVSFLLVVPAAAARNLAGGAGALLRWSVAIALFSAVMGSALSSWRGNWPTGSTVVLVSCGCFALSLILARLRR